MRRNNLVSIIVLVVIFGGLGGYFGIRYLIHEHKVGPFNAQAPDFLEVKGSKDTTTVVMGKVIIFDEATRKVDKDVYFDLPDDLRATTPEEVGTVVLVTWSEQKIDEYDNHVPAIQRSGHVKIVDRA